MKSLNKLMVKVFSALFLNIKVMTYTLNHRSYMNYTYKKRLYQKNRSSAVFIFIKNPKNYFPITSTIGFPIFPLGN